MDIRSCKLKEIFNYYWHDKVGTNWNWIKFGLVFIGFFNGFYPKKPGCLNPASNTMQVARYFHCRCLISKPQQLSSLFIFNSLRTSQDVVDNVGIWQLSGVIRELSKTQEIVGEKILSGKTVYRYDLYCVGWGVKLYSLTDATTVFISIVLA